MKTIVDWVARAVLLVFAVLWVGGSEGAGRVIVVFYTVTNVIVIPVFLVLLGLSLNAKYLAVLRKSCAAAFAKTRRPVMVARWLWVVTVIAFLAWMGNTVLSGFVMFAAGLMAVFAGVLVQPAPDAE